MEKFRGTPGPWEVAGPCCDAVGTEFDSAWYKTICHRPERTGGKLTDEYNANMRLIAAAPELLEALQDFMASASGEDGSCGHSFECVCRFDKAKAAIAKALAK